jgi:predicted nucleotidyltransferase
MKSIDEVREIITKHREVIKDKYGIAIVGIFGSYVRGDQEQQSDIDLLADVLRPISLIEMVGAEIYLSEALKIKVDLVPKRSVREELRDDIFEEAISI